VARSLTIWYFSTLFFLSCSHAAYRGKSFDEICKLVEGRTTVEVEQLLGKPDFHEVNVLGDERWLWWNSVTLAGASYPPEVRNRLFHLEITFVDPSHGAKRPSPHSQWRVRNPFGVSYLIPQTQKSM
jgi:hypothetical protein